MKAKTETLTIRMTPEMKDQLNELCGTWGLTKTQVIERLVYGEWCKSTEIGKAKIKEAMETFGVLQKQIEGLTNAIK